MESVIKLNFIGLLLALTACVEEPEQLPNVNDNLSEEEAALVGTWQYVSIDANGVQFRIATAQMELSQDKNAAGGNRAEIEKRRVYYAPDGTYQLRWLERGDYTLGTLDHPNWQPNFGFWQLSNDTLYHNRGATHAQSYLITLSRDKLSRSSHRYMSEALTGANWNAGDIVLQEEQFIKILE
ncbi:MAG: hypothetical protein RIA69_11615 [Cyclobacteriaceae bacterium]